MPGTAKLAGELGVGMRTVSDALDQLENEGLLVNQGRRKKRRIVVPDDAVSEGFRVGILLYDKDSRDNPISRNLKIRLSEAGFQVDFCDMTLLDMKMDVKQVGILFQKKLLFNNIIVIRQQIDYHPCFRLAIAMNAKTYRSDKTAIDGDFFLKGRVRMKAVKITRYSGAVPFQY